MWSRARVLLVPAVALAMAMTGAGCGSAADSGGQAKDYFVHTVYPQIEPTCLECHATGKRGAPVFLSDTPEGSYKAISETPGYIAPASLSPLVQKGLHTGPALTDVQERIVTQWLLQEPKGGKSTDSRPTNLRAALKLFGDCMDYQEWTTLGLEKMGETVSQGGPCTSCHNAGEASVWFSTDPALTFRKLSTFPYVQRLVTGSVDDNGHFDRILDAQRIIVKGKERPRNANHHPAFNLGDGIQGVTPYDMQDNLTKFVSNTINKMYRPNGCTNAAKPDGGVGDGG